MTKKGAFWFFIISTLISAIILIVLTIDTHRQVSALTHADRLDSKVIAGKKVWEKYNCNDCHTILGFGGYYAPDMTKVYKRRGEDAIRFILKNPEKAFKNSWRKMPNQHLSDDEIDKLIAFLKWVSEIDNHDWPPQDSRKSISRTALKLTESTGMKLGIALFKTKGCIACHKIKGIGGSVGPALDKVGSKYSEDYLKKFIRNPQSIKPNSAMPPQSQLSEGDLEALVKYLKSL